MIRRTLLSALLSAAFLPAAHAAQRLPVPDIDAALAADALEPGPRPYRYAAPISVDLSPATAGSWRIDDAGQAHWNLELEAPGATSLSLQFADLALPAGARLSVTGLRDGERRGPYGAGDGIDGRLWTPIVQGDAARVSLRLPAAARDALDLRIVQVNYGFRGFGAPEIASKSGACNVDVACEIAEAWENEIRSVARISINGLFLCTGQLINNTAEDFTPYFLTAAHCLATELEANGTVFYFNYETGSCGGTPDGRLEQSISGASLIATSGRQGPDLGPDFTLLLMNQAPPEAFRPYYSGWDNSDTAPLGVTAIHHPAGDEKRISFEYDQTEITWYGDDPGSPLSQLLPTHLKIPDWDVGTTEGGSSGSGIWNENHHLVGQLSGGSAACGNDAPDWYGRFHQNWYFLDTELTSLASYLDPLGSGVETLDGADPFPLPEDQAGGTEQRSHGLTQGGAVTWSLLLLGLLAGLGRRR